MYIKNELSKNVYDLALKCGYDKCGIINIDETSEYKKHLDIRMSNLPESKTFYKNNYRFAEMRKNYPWAKSIIICGYWYGKYKVPKELKYHYGRSYLMDARRDEDSAEYKARYDFEDGLNSMGLKFYGNRFKDITAFRLSAYKAGLGIIRKNNFVYTEKGSWIYWDAWVVEEDMEVICDTKVKPCSDNCNKCQKACATNTLCSANTMNPYKCSAFVTSLNSDDLMNNPIARDMKHWIYGCDDCQNACIYNSKTEETEEFPNLNDIKKYLTPDAILGSDYKVLKEIVQPKFWYIEQDELWKFKVNALNAINNMKELPENYNELISIAKGDKYKEVRDMAEWVYKCQENNR